jgi:hypothetical protein
MPQIRANLWRSAGFMRHDPRGEPFQPVQVVGMVGMVGLFLIAPQICH